MKHKKVAILGLGTVGGGTAKILLERREIIKAEYDIDIELKKILVHNLDRSKKRNIANDLLTDNYDDILNDDEIDVVAECIGGIEPAKEYILKALKKGKSVVTANKELFSKHWLEFEEVAKKTGAGTYYEATSGGGIPIIRTMTTALQANDILEIKAIINGTSNFILSKMDSENASYTETLKEAQALGYAEADPTADVEGYDAMYKLAILSTLAYNRYLNPAHIFREGITNITQEDIAFGKKFGYTIKLLAISKLKGKKIEARVHPVFVKNKYPLASVNDSFNAILLNGNNVGDLMLYGRGAGERPTGSAVVSDIVFAARADAHARYNGIEKVIEKKDIEYNFESEYYVNIQAKDKAGALAQVTKVFSDNKVSIRSMYQEQNTNESKSLPVILFTHKTKEKNMQKSIAQIKKIKDIEKINNVIRVEN